MRRQAVGRTLDAPASLRLGGLTPEQPSAYADRGKVAPRVLRRYCRSMRRIWVWLTTQLRWIWGASEMSVLFGDYPENSDRERR
jgi:hypothetical protein